MTDSTETEKTESKQSSISGCWRILIVEDEELFARAVKKSLERAGHECTTAGSLAEARNLYTLPAQTFDVVILDMRLPDGEGFDLMPELAAVDDDAAPSVIVLTAYGDISQAVQAIKRGAADYLKKPVDLDELLIVIDKVMKSAEIRSRLSYSFTRETRIDAAGELLGGSEAMREVRRQIELIAEISSASPPTVLIEGETGTGKDVAARLLHRLGSRSNRPFVHVDCTVLPSEMMEAELFGHVRGSFTSAVASRAGLIEAAEDGTVFLDEVGELPLDLQSKLLNVLERRQLRRIGSTRETPVQARFIAATNRNLAEMVEQGQFRSDLFFRLDVLKVSMPPLRKCREDIPILLEAFLVTAAREFGRPVPKVIAGAVSAMKSYNWPGNVRELRNAVERALLLTEGNTISADMLNFVSSSNTAFPHSRKRGPSARKGIQLDTLADAERLAIEAALKATSGNVSEAARRLGTTRMKLRYRLDKYGIRPADYLD